MHICRALKKHTDRKRKICRTLKQTDRKSRFWYVKPRKQIDRKIKVEEMK